MKTLNPLLKSIQKCLVLFFLNTLFLVGSMHAQVVGTGAPTPYPTLSSAAGAVLTVTGGVCTNNFTVIGDFIIDMPVDFQGSSITFQANSGFTIQDHLILSNSANISGLQPGTYINEFFPSLTTPTLVFQAFNSTIRVLSMEHDGSSTIWEFDNSYVNVNDRITVSNGCNLLIRNNSFIDFTDITCEGSPLPYLEITDSQMHNNCEVTMNSGNAVAFNVYWWGTPVAFQVGDGTQIGTTLPVQIMIWDSEFDYCNYGINGLLNSSLANHVYNSEFSNGLAAVATFTADFIFNQNEVDLCSDVAVLFEAAQSEIKDNTITNSGTVGASGYGAIYSLLGGNGTIEDNVIDNCYRGISLSSSITMQVNSNTVTNGTNHGIFQENSFNVQTINNTTNTTTDAGFLMDNVDEADVWCNLFQNSSNGAEFSNTCMNLDYQQNLMKDNTTHGLFYQTSLDAAPQIEKGNLWQFNNFDAKFDGPPTPTKRFDNRYIVRPVVFEDPATKDPVTNWFFNTGTSLPALNCFTIGDPVEGDQGNQGFNEAEVFANHIDCESNKGLGQCMWNKMLVLNKIENDPTLLNNTDLHDFYNTYQGRTLDELPLLSEILPTLLLPDDLKFDFQFQYDSGGNVLNWNEYVEYMMDRIPEMKSFTEDNNIEIENWISDIEQINTTNQLELDYKDLLLFTLQDKIGNLDYQREKNRIQFLANQCLGEYGPAIYLARTLSRSNEWDYTEKFTCTTSNRSSNDALTEEIISVKILPNPSVDRVEIISNRAIRNVLITDVSGKVFFDKSGIQDNKVSINVEQFPSGVYFVNSKSWNQPKKLIIQ